MLSSQQRNINGSKLCSFTCYAIASVAEAVQTHAAQSGVQALHIFYAIFFQSVNGNAYRQYGGFADILND